MRESVLPGTEILERARLAPDDAADPGRIARAIRAELWHGSLGGARLQARLGASKLTAAAHPWRAPALLYLGLGREHAAAVCAEATPTIVAECATDLAAIRQVLRRSPIDAITRLIEMVDILGPILCLLPTRPLIDIADAAAELTGTAEAAAANANDALAAAGAREAARRLQHWPRIGLDRDAAAAVVGSYEWSTGTPPVWDEHPRMELVMASDVATGAVHSELLPGTLTGHQWSANRDSQ